MKRSDIRNAYDRMNPTQTQRDQMYRAIMKKSERQSAQKTVVIRRLLRIPAAVAMAVIVVIGAFAVVRNEHFTLRLKPTEPTEIIEAIDYEELLNVYRTAVTENWTAELCVENGISPQLAGTKHMEDKPAYIILDIDGNGVEDGR